MEKIEKEKEWEKNNTPELKFKSLVFAGIVCESSVVNVNH